MKFLTVSLDYPPTVGGIAAVVYELSQAQKQLGHDVTLLTKKLPPYAASEQMVEGIRVVPLPKRRFGPLYGRTINKAIDAAIATYQPDIVHLHGMRPLEHLTPKRVPVVYTNHTSGFLKRLEKGGRRVRRLQKLFAPLDLIVAPSEELLDLPFDIGAQKQFISNGIVPERFVRDEAKRQQLRAELGLSADDVLAIVTRRLVEKNGVIHLANAVKHISNKHLKLLLIGDGPERQAIEDALATHFAGRYIMLGALQHHQIVPYYSAADFSILPSLMEATSISCLEAMAAGLPILASNVGGLPFLVTDGENGYLSQPAKPESLAINIEKLMAGDMAAMGAASKAAVDAQFSWLKIAEQTVNAYRKVL